MWSVAMLGLDYKPMITKAYNNFEVMYWIRDSGTVKDNINLLWSIAVFGLMREHSIVLGELWGALMKKLGLGTYSKEDWQMMATIYQLATADGVELRVPEGIMEKLEGVGGNEGDVVEDEEFMIEIIKDIKAFGFDGFERNVSPFDDNGKDFGLNMNVSWKEAKVVLEIDGPSNFLTTLYENERRIRQKRGRLDGLTKAKTRMYERLGWKVVRISDEEWKALVKKGDDKERSKFWVDLFGKVGLSRGNVKGEMGER